MIYLSSFSADDKRLPQERYAISRTQPAGCTYPVIPYLCPPAGLILSCKQGEITREQFAARYLEMLDGPCSCPRSLAEPHAVQAHLEAIKAEVENGRDLALLSWEPPGSFSHRQLVARRLIELGLDPELIVTE